MKARRCGLLLFFASWTAGAQTPLTLEEVLTEAHAANAKLPVAGFDVTIAQEKHNEARAERWLRVAVEGDFIYAPPSGYDPVLTNLGEFRLQAVGRQPIYDGGSRRAAVAKTQAELEAATGHYRMEEKDLVLDVTSRYNELLAARQEADTRRAGIERLENYRSLLQSRQASGQAVTADRLKTEVRLDSEKANVLEAEKRADDARLSLNDLMGRDPQGALVIAVLSVPDPSAPPEPATWEEVPEISSAQADTRAAEAALEVARAERRPHLDLSADVGFWGSDTSRWIPLDIKATDPGANFWDRVKRDAGYSISLFFSWPVFDFGAVRARIAQADVALRQARQKVEVARRDARLKWEQARSAIESLRREIELLVKSAPAAKDAWLDAESRYRGGATTSLEVLDAYASAIDATVRLSDATSRYRIAQALLARWGTP